MKVSQVGGYCKSLHLSLLFEEEWEGFRQVTNCPLTVENVNTSEGDE